MTRTNINENIAKNYKEQEPFIKDIKSINDKYFLENGVYKTFYIGTFGCQMNVRDSETLNGILVDLGYKESKTENDADIIIYNTCCVRENAENKVYGNLGFLKTLKKKNPNLKVILCGCMMQQNSVIEKIKKSYRNVDVIFGTYNIHRLPELLKANFDSGEMILDIWEEHSDIVLDLPAVRENRFKASVNIMFGCNNFCTYCIVPYVRGRERSREVDDILNEIENLVKTGAKEIMLLGQNVNSYGLTLDNPITFSDLLRKVNNIDGIKRIRFVTSHPKDMSDDLIKAMTECDKICKHLHLPFQSGSTNILNKMNRRYTKDHYLNLIEKVKKSIPDVGITTDIIVGFPGETEEDFLNTLDVVEKCGFCAAFTFIYSKRTGTPASNMTDQIDEEIIKERFTRLLEKVNNGFYDFNKSFVGKTVEVLVEEVNIQNKDLLTGRNEQNITVHFEGDQKLVGEIVNVKITSHKSFYLSGELQK